MDSREVQKKKKPWPTKKAMEQIYELNLWGSNDSEFYSGFGSHHPELVEPYIQKVTSFLTSFKLPLTICDLGCGDFNVGKQLVKVSQQFVAIDIVPNLVAFNTKKFKAKNLQFRCLDIVNDSLPETDCVLLRQVLQHLSNAEVQKVVAKLANYKYVILTEHLPNGSFIANKDIISGQGIRIKKQSGLDILKAPFYFNPKEVKEIFRYNLENNKGVIVTWLFTVF